MEATVTEAVAPVVPVSRCRCRSRQHAREGGQALVELALVLMVCMLLLVGTIDVGRAATMAVAVQGGAGAAARLGAQRVVDFGVTDQAIMQRLIDSSAPFLSGCTATGTNPMTCSPAYGGTWTLSVIYPGGAVTEGSSVEVKAVGAIAPLASLARLASAVGLGAITVTADAQSVML